MDHKKRLNKLEMTERAPLLRQVEDAEKRLLRCLTEEQRFAVFVILMMNDLEVRNAPKSEQITILRRRRDNAPIPKLRADVKALQWALEQFKDYGKVTERIN